MLTIVAVDPAAIPSGETGAAVSAVASFARRYECLLACAERTPGDTTHFVAALRGELPRFRFVPLLGDPGTREPVDRRLLTQLLEEGAVPVVAASDVAAMPLAATLAAYVRADALWRVADGPEGVTLHVTEWLPVRPGQGCLS
jgi:hypothetical protein